LGRSPKEPSPVTSGDFGLGKKEAEKEFVNELKEQKKGGD